MTAGEILRRPLAMVQTIYKFWLNPRLFHGVIATILTSSSEETKSKEIYTFYASDVLFTLQLLKVLFYYLFIFFTLFEYDQLYFSELLLDKDGKPYKKGDTITNKKYAKTLEIIQQHPESFYSGRLAKNISRDMIKIYSKVSRTDLRKYETVIRKPLKGDLSNMTMYLSPPPSSGAVLALILNILKG